MHFILLGKDPRITEKVEIHKKRGQFLQDWLNKNPQKMHHVICR